MRSELEDQVDVHLRHGGGRVNPESPLDVWSDAFRDCLGAWEEEIVRPFQGRLMGDEAEEAIHAV